MSKNFKNILSLSIITFIFILPAFSWAQSTEGPDGPSTEGPSSDSSQVIKIPPPFKGTGNTIEGFINLIIKDILMPIGGVVAVLMVMWAGFLYVTAGGKPAQIEKAHKAFLAAVIGAAILLGAYVISSAISKTLEAFRT